MTPFKGWSPYLVSSIQDAYPEMEDVFYAELGNHFMNKEGNICMAMAEWAVREQVPVLTIHDSFICQSNLKEMLANEVGRAFCKISKVPCVIK